ncbi:ubiquinone/menaquinone biosynthesis C-methylase UbiE [Methanohalophilus levihalophilus]|uniref:class I SAM-dependent methyltransferase n=1 Tax=Methanohalophilus levihalophilus TaxID=1431282 RepID=UPI001AE317E8|nr:class I SAM-dependent methyltransferase [Methanohalophilus levihalophilus]MBP2029097.1 ubiquinone/menaquinone biosynthesis C-methylase UbiE [Methanohalophilus levihalophilus]
MVSPSRRRKRERRFWTKVSSGYDEWINRDFADQYETFKPRVASAVLPEDEILEVGTGTGEIAIHLAPKCRSVNAVDISPEMIAIANSKKMESGTENIEFKVEDAYSLSFDDCSFTKVIAVNSLQTMKQPSEAMLEGYRVLRNSGEFISITYCYGDTGLFERLKLMKWAFQYGIPGYWNNFRKKDLVSKFKEAGFEILETEWVWKHPRVLFLRCRKNIGCNDYS